MRVKELVAFIKERESIRVKKESGKPRPWTKDEILGKYRFCNVHREDDRVTRELKTMLAERIRDEGPLEDAWFWWVVARLFNKPNTLAYIDCVAVPFQPERMRKRLKQQREACVIFNGAYIVSTNGVAMDKVDYLIDRVLNPLWKDRKAMRPLDGDELVRYHRSLMHFDGLGSFIAAQIVADLKYMEPLKSAPDWWTFAASGPGSRRGLNRVVGRDPKSPWSETAWREALEKLRRTDGLNSLIIGNSMLHAQDLQNCLCEFDKYERARLGEGTPKQIYKER